MPAFPTGSARTPDPLAGSRIFRALGVGTHDQCRPDAHASHRCRDRECGTISGSKDLGTLEPGKWADLIVIDRDPLQDIKNTRTIRDVYIAGNRVH